MKELQKKEFSDSGGKNSGSKIVLSKRTRIVTFIFSVMTILITAGIMHAANVYYDLDTSKIMMNDSVSATAGLNVTTGNLDVGAGNFIVAPGSGDATTKGKIGLEETGVGNYKTYFQAGDQTAFGGNITYTLPVNDGTVGQVLQTDGTGVLSWTAAGSVVTVGSMTGSQVFNDSSATGDWLGLGLGAGRIAFDDQATDYVNILNANVGIGNLAPGELLTLGTAGSTAGVLSMAGATSGKVIIQPASSTANYTLTLPDTAGTNGYVLKTNGSGGLSWSGTSAAAAHNILDGSVHGDTALATAVQGGIITAIGGATWNQLAPGAAGTFLVSGGAGANLSWGSSIPTLTLSSTGSLTVGTSSSALGQIVYKNATNANTQTIEASAATGNYTYVLPSTKGGTFAMTSDVGSVGAGGVLRGQVNIFGFDYPTQCSTSCDGAAQYAVFSKRMNDFPNFPAVLSGKTRQYKLIIRYATTTATSGDTSWQVYNVTDGNVDNNSGVPFTIAETLSGDLTQGSVFITNDLALTAHLTTNGDDWEIRAKVANDGASDVLRVYSIDLAAYDVD